MKAGLPLLLSIACASCADQNQGTVVAELSSLTLRIPHDQEITDIYVSKLDATGQPGALRSVSFDICDQHVVEKPEWSCDLHGDHGTWVRIEEPLAGFEFSILREKPLGVERPGEFDLLPLAGIEPREMPFRSSKSAEYSALRRIRSKVWGDNPPLSTTDRAWPIADCDQHAATGGFQCRFGFLVNETPVVAYWFSPTTEKRITQAKAWDVASDIDRRLRRLSV